MQRAPMSSGDWVSDGRDVGSTVRPDADPGVFLTATPQERAYRRRAELAAGGVYLDEAQVLTMSAAVTSSTARGLPAAARGRRARS